MLDSGDKLKVDQTHLETVIPAIGKELKVHLTANTPHRTNIFLKINIQNLTNIVMYLETTHSTFNSSM